MKRLLMIYPNNFLQGAMGTNNRVSQLVKIFKGIGFEIDYFSYENFSSDSTFKNFNEQNKDHIINKLFLYDFQKGYTGKSQEKKRGVFYKEKLKQKINRTRERQYLADWVPIGAQWMFTDILKENQYDVIITFYTYLATLFQNREINAKKIYFMEDSMFLQQYSWDKDNIEGISMGKLMDEEIERLRVFDEVFCISNDERIFYEKITGKAMHFLPHLLPSEMGYGLKRISERRWDVYFIGFNNPFNVEGLKWFLEKVYPHLSKSIKILLVGSATKNIDIKYNNVDVIPFAPDLEEIYSDVKIAICPMLHGTGMKVKVVEAMSKGLPVVCNERGVDGIPDKTRCGCLVTQDEIKFAEYINKLVNDPSYYEKISNDIQKYYSEMFNAEQYIELLRKVTFK